MIPLFDLHPLSNRAFAWAKYFFSDSASDRRDDNRFIYTPFGYQRNDKRIQIILILSEIAKRSGYQLVGNHNTWQSQI